MNRLWSACHAEPLEQRRLLTFNPLGPEFIANETTTNQQISPVVAMDADGDYVVVWSTNGQDGDGYGIFARLFDNTGTAKGPEFQINVYTSGNQVAPSVAMDPFGNFVVAWESYFQDLNGYGVYARRFDEFGVGQPWTDTMGGQQNIEFQVDDFTIGDQRQPAVATDGAGNFVITWTTPATIPFSENLTGVRAQRYDGLSNRLGGVIQVNEYTSAEQNEPAIAVDPNGEFIISWSSNGQGASGYGIFAKRFNVFGIPISSEFAAGPTTARPQRNSSVALSPTGQYVIAWQSQGGPAVVRHFNADNTPTTDDMVAAIWTAFTTSTQNRPKVKLTGDGDFVVMWTGPNDTGPFKGVYGIKFSPDRSVTSGEFLVNSDTSRTVRAVAFDMTSDGKVVAAWAGNDPSDANNSDIYTRLFTDDAPTDIVSVTRDVATVVEGDPTNSVFTVTRGSSSGDLLVRMIVSGTAAGGSLNDYVFTADPSVNLRTDYATLLITIPDGQTTATFTLVQNDDTLVEGDQTAIVTLNSSFSYLVDGVANTASVTIEDNDMLDMVVEPTLLSVTEGGSLTFSVRLTAAPEEDLIVTIMKQAGGDDDLTADKTQLTFTSANFATPQIVTVSAAQDADDQIGQATFVVSGTGLTTQNVLAVEADDEADPTPTPGRPDLSAASDHGRSATDNITNLDNSTIGNALTFDIPNTVVGATVQLFANGQLVGTATATTTTTSITTTGSLNLADGNHVFTARQTELGKVISAPSTGLTVTIDTVAPVITISEAGGQSDPTDALPIRFSLLSSDEIWDLTFDKVGVSGTANAQTVVISGTNRTFFAEVSGIAQSGTVIINMPDGLVHDVAGNATAPTVVIDNQITYNLNQVLPPNGLPFAEVTAGKLTVNGTDIDTFPDVITVVADGTDVVATVNGNAFRFAASSITSIEVYANAGNDRVTIGPGLIETYVLGGYGNDTLIGGTGNDSLSGAAGKDLLIGNGGNDRLAGGKHNDRADGGEDNDRLYGDEANDSLDGGIGRDRMYGGDGNDTMLGGNHNDTMYGDAGNDSMDGQNHNDRLFPGTGRDTARGSGGQDNVFAADGAGEIDSLDGGEGNDGVQSDPDDLLNSFEFDIT